MSDTRAALRREQVQVLLAAVPVLIAGYFLVGAVGTFAGRPWVVAMVLLPLIAVVWALGVPLVRERRVLLGGGFLPFFVAYCLLFSVAAGTRILEVRRETVLGFESETPSNVLGLGRLGDWHYWFTRPAPPANDLLVITLPSFAGQEVAEARIVELNLVAQALNNHARGIAFDFNLDTESPVDGILCAQIQRAESASVPVILGYAVDEVSGTVVRHRLAPKIAECVPEARLGTVIGLRQADKRVRMVPTSHLGDTALRSFSYRIASVLSRGKTLPPVGLAQFVEPSRMPDTLSGAPDSLHEELMRGRFVLVGSDRPADRYDTPFGTLSGVMIHALAAHALRGDYLIRRLDMGWMLLGVFVLCYVLTMVQARGVGAGVLWLSAGVMMASIFIAAALAMRVGLVWIDTSYPVLAVGVLAAILSGGARLQRTRMETARKVRTTMGNGVDVRRGGTQALSAGDAVDSDGAAPEAFDVFLSHNSKDKPAVIAMAEALRTRGIRVWLDVWELVPGRPWQVAVEQAITHSASAAVLVGADGLGPWEEPEMRAVLDECVRRRMSVIPVLLPDVSGEPALPLFLRQFTWVDLRPGLTDAGLDRLEWGITGVKPRRR